MLQRPCIGLYAFLGALLVAAAPAAAQFTPRTLNDPATGETYHIEGSIGLWRPTFNGTVSSEGLGIPGSLIDLKSDLNLQDSAVPEFQLVLRPTRKFKLRGQAISMKYDQTARLSRDLVFNGQRYRASTDVGSTLEWQAYRAGIEYDFVSRDRGFGGLLLEVKPTVVRAALTSASPAFTEDYETALPIPALGGIARFYPVPNISITGEASGIKIPNIGDQGRGHYFDLDIYGTVNFTNNVGAKFGYRQFNVDFLVDGTAATVTMKGIYFGFVARY